MAIQGLNKDLVLVRAFITSNNLTCPVTINGVTLIVSDRVAIISSTTNTNLGVATVTSITAGVCTLVPIRSGVGWNIIVESYDNINNRVIFRNTLNPVTSVLQSVSIVNSNIIIYSVFRGVVANQAAMLALSAASTGDYCYRLDEEAYYQFTNATWSLMSDNSVASMTTKGVVQEATQLQVTSGTDIGSTGARLFVSPSKLNNLTNNTLSSVIPNAVYVNPSHPLASDAYTYIQARANPNRPVSSFQRACDIAGINTIVICESIATGAGAAIVGGKNILLFCNVTLTVNRAILFQVGGATHPINITSQGRGFINIATNILVNVVLWGASLNVINTDILGTGDTLSGVHGADAILLKNSKVTRISSVDWGSSVRINDTICTGNLFFDAQVGLPRSIHIYRSLFYSSVIMSAHTSGLIYDCTSTGLISNSVGVQKIFCNENIPIIDF